MSKQIDDLADMLNEGFSLDHLTKEFKGNPGMLAAVATSRPELVRSSLPAYLTEEDRENMAQVIESLILTIYEQQRYFKLISEVIADRAKSIQDFNYQLEQLGNLAKFQLPYEDEGVED